MDTYFALICEDELDRKIIDFYGNEVDYYKIKKKFQLMRLFSGVCKVYGGKPTHILIEKGLDKSIEANYIVEGVQVENKIFAKDNKIIRQSRVIYHSSNMNHEIIECYKSIYGEDNAKLSELDDDILDVTTEN